MLTPTTHTSPLSLSLSLSLCVCSSRLSSLRTQWHLGLYKKWALPLSRGFDEQYGYYLGGEDYWTHSRSGGLDWHRNDTLCTAENGTYSSVLLGDAASNFVAKHAAVDTPWFLYLPFQSVHSPLQAPTFSPARYTNKTIRGSQLTRAKMVSALDDGVGVVLATLKSTQQLDNTLIVFTSDNGAPDGDALDMTYGSGMMDLPEWRATHGGIDGNAPRPSRPPTGTGYPPHGGGGGSNWPMSGWKHWVFEGGVRSAAFIRYPPITGGPRAGTVHAGLFHSVDWLPTIMAIVGGDTARNLPLDGLDITASLTSGKASDSPRKEIPIQITACSENARGWGGGTNIVDGPQAAMIVEDLKLIVDCYWRDSKNTSGAHVQLYNITSDIAEMDDLAAKRPEDVKRIIARLDYWEGISVDPYNDHSIDKSCGGGKPQGKHPPHWGPWC